MPRSSTRLLLHVALACGLAVGSGAFVGEVYAQSQRQAGLVPANFNPKQDSQGFNWDIQGNGTINDGTSDCFDTAAMLTINGQQYGGGQGMQTPEGELVLRGSVAGLNLTRRIKLDADRAACRYIEVLENPTQQPIQAQLMLMTNLGVNCQSVTTDQAAPFSGTLNKGETSVICEQQPGSRPSVVFVLRSPRATKIAPTINNQSNRTFQVSFSVTVPAGKTVSVMHLILQRRPGSLPKDAKALAKELTPFFKDRKFLADVPREIKRTLVNWPAGGAGMDEGESPAFWTVHRDLEVEPGPADILAVGAGTRLKGTAHLEGVAIRTPMGELAIDPAQVAGLVGEKSRGKNGVVYLRDGQMLSGELAAQKVRFDLNSGVAMDLTPQTLDRIVSSQAEGDGEPPQGAAAMLETFEGHRLALAAGQPLELPLATPWGARTVGLSELLWIRAMTGERTGYQVKLRDGSRFSCFLEGAPVEAHTLLFGPQTFSATQIRAVNADLAPVSEEEEPVEEPAVRQPYVMLAGEQMVVGTLDGAEVRLLTVSGAIPIPVSQVRTLRNVTEDAGPMPGEGAAVFEAQMWDGGTAVGRLADATLAVRTGGVVWQVPGKDVVEVTSPTPHVTPEVRARIVNLIRDLGDPVWAKREEATAELKSLGVLAAAQLREATEQSEDEEIKRRAELILAELE